MQLERLVGYAIVVVEEGAWWQCDACDKGGTSILRFFVHSLTTSIFTYIHLRLRAKLVFPPVHSSIRGVSLAVNNFERQSEEILRRKDSVSPLMVPICNSLTELSLALQVATSLL